jgi:Putative auto-transporter adhesin, head GIN domain
MKKLITMAVAILITACIAAFASGKAPVAMPQKQFNYQMSFNKIEVADDIDLQLKESDNKIINVTGNDADVENVDWKIKDDVLYLKSKKGSLKNKVHVAIDVTRLKKIVVKGQSTVSSAGPLLSPVLYVYMEGNCYVAIKNTGKIYVINSDNIEVDVKKAVGDVTICK